MNLDEIDVPTYNDTTQKFVAVFGRFEYALKQIGCFTEKNGWVNIKWDAFACKKGFSEYFEGLCKNDTDFSNAVDYLLDDKPKRPSYSSDKGFEWQNWSFKHKEPHRQIFEAILQARNNLFHGGKFVYNMGGTDRENEVVNNSLFVLWKIKDWNETKDFFWP